MSRQSMSSWEGNSLVEDHGAEDDSLGGQLLSGGRHRSLGREAT